MFCPNCGTENPPGSRFCTHCGSAFPDSQQSPYQGSDVTSLIPTGGFNLGGSSSDTDPGFSTEAHQGAVDALATGTALLVVKRGPNAGSRFLLDQDLTTAGRHPDSDIFLDDVTVSRRHADFVRSAEGFLVRDVGSLNGTYVNRQRIDSVTLAGADEVQIGKFRLVFLTAAPGKGPSR